VADGTLYRTWMPDPAATGDHWLEVAWPTPRSLTAWCLFGHTAVAEIAAEVWNGAVWVPFAGGPVVPVGCVYRTAAAPAVATRARFRVQGPATLRIASLFLGTDLVCAAGLRPGWVDPALGQQQQVVPATSRTGISLPGIVEDEFLEGRLQLPDVPLPWAKQHWLPFKRHAQTKPFWLRWHDDEAPAFCQGARFDDEAFSRPGLVSVGLTCRMEVA
jgi:hypothetical protein